eukprot:10594878-Alexandrium_andersonii.AAC.1
MNPGPNVQPEGGGGPSTPNCPNGPLYGSGSAIFGDPQSAGLDVRGAARSAAPPALGSEARLG